MSWVKEARELVQDLIALELRAIGAKIDALNLRMDEQTRALSLRIDEQGQTVEKRSAERHSESKAEIAALRTDVASYKVNARLRR